MKITEVRYRRLVSFRDPDGTPANEVLGATAQVDPEHESARECRERVIEWVEVALNGRGTLRNSLKELEWKKEAMEDEINHYREERNRLMKDAEELCRAYHLEIGGYLPF